MLAGQIAYIRLLLKSLQLKNAPLEELWQKEDNSPLPAAAHFEDATLELIKHSSDKCGRTPE